MGIATHGSEDSTAKNDGLRPNPAEFDGSESSITSLSGVLVKDINTVVLYGENLKTLIVIENLQDFHAFCAI